MVTNSKFKKVSPPAQSSEPRILTPLPPEPSPVPELSPVPKHSPAPQDLIPPMPCILTPEPESLIPVLLLPRKYKFGPKNINGMQTFCFSFIS